MRVWNRSYHETWHLHGHSHGDLPDIPTSLSMDVGVDTHDFRPWHFDEINLLMIEKAEAVLVSTSAPLVLNGRVRLPGTCG
jgi:calcineurin-like phosphoesterase family protein